MYNTTACNNTNENHDDSTGSKNDMTSKQNRDTTYTHNNNITNDSNACDHNMNSTNTSKKRPRYY